MKLPLISILLSTHNGARTIGYAIESVLTQSTSDWELIIIDDGSTDAIGEVVRKFAEKDPRILYLKNEKNLGIQKSLNVGLSKSKGKYIAKIDDDDAWRDPEKLEKQVKFLDENEEYVLVGTGAIVINEEGKELFRYVLPEKDEDIRNRILSKNCFVNSSTLFKKRAALNFGGYDESVSTLHIEDYDLWLKLGTIGKFANLREYSVIFMERHNSVSSQNRITQAKRVIFEIKKFRYAYPKFIKGYLFSVLRLIFFIVQKKIHVSRKLIHGIKKIYKQY